MTDMTVVSDLPAGEPLGFPKCPRCPYVKVGPARICVACASKSLEPIGQAACPVCCQMLDSGVPCRNWLCNDANRRIERIDAVAYYSGELASKIRRYKYEGKFGWALIFGRLLVGWLEAHAGNPSPDLIVANPTYLEPGDNRIGHIEAIIRSAAVEDVERRWAFDGAHPAIVKTRATAKSAGQSGAAKRAAATALYEVLRVPDPARTAGRGILVFDDICTTGSQLDAVARRLLDDGQAAHVHALVLGRAPWRPR
jgi:predicted amidophosphoribosyltransferase